MQSLVSVIIPTFNRAEYTVEAINSVLEQTYKNLEVILVDDGSTDNTREIIEDIEDSRVKYIYQQNSGPSAARNNGIRNAKGEYIAFLDSDDIWFKDKLEKQMRLFTQKPQLGIVSAWSVFVSEDKQINPKISKIESSFEYIKGVLLFPFYFPELPGTSDMVIKKECFDKVGLFDETMEAKEDWDMWLRIAAKYDFYCLNESLDFRRIKHQRLTNTTDFSKARSCCFRFLRKTFSNKSLPLEITRLKNQAYSNNYSALGYRLLYGSKNRELSQKYLLKSLKLCKSKLFMPTFIITLSLTCCPVTLTNLINRLKALVKAVIKREKI